MAASGAQRKLDLTQTSKGSKLLCQQFANKVVGQEKATQALVDIFEAHQAGFGDSNRPAGNALFLGPTGTGKCLDPHTPILMFDGTIKEAQSVLRGDMLMGPDSRPRRVLSITSGYDEMYDVFPTKGDFYRVNKPHILSLTMTPNKQYAKPKTNYPRHRVSNAIVNLSVEEYLTKSKFFRHRAKGYRVGVSFAEQNLPLDPYFLGLWLGDGDSHRASVTTVDKEIEDTVRDTAKHWGLHVTKNGGDNRTPTYHISTQRKTKLNTIMETLKTLGLLHNKHVPLSFKANSRKNRLSLLAGYLDADGHLNNNGFEYLSVSRDLAMDVAFVARSLGLACYVKLCRKSCQTGVWGTYYRGSISGDVSQIPCKLKRKQGKPRKQIKNVLRTGIQVRPAGMGYYSGFEIDGDGLFLLGDFTVTHNTHVVESFAEALFGNKRACIRVDCAEFQHSHEIAKLVGSPPGYLGHRETSPVFTQELLAKYHTDDLKLSVVLFDEVEKASDSLWSLLLGILDNATLTLGDNKKVDFSKVIIVMTSNLGSAEMLNRDIGFAEITEERDQARLEQIALSAVKSKFTPEFLNRIQNIVTFMTLTKEQIEQILEFELRDLAVRLFVLSSPIVVANELGLVPPKNVVPRFQFAVSPCARRRLIEEGYDKAYGARHIKRAVERCIQKPLSKLVLSNQVRTDDTIIIDYCVGSGFEFYAQGQPEPPIDTTRIGES